MMGFKSRYLLEDDDWEEGEDTGDEIDNFEIKKEYQEHTIYISPKNFDKGVFTICFHIDHKTLPDVKRFTAKNFKEYKQQAEAEYLSFVKHVDSGLETINVSKYILPSGLAAVTDECSGGFSLETILPNKAKDRNKALREALKECFGMSKQINELNNRISEMSDE